MPKMPPLCENISKTFQLERLASAFQLSLGCRGIRDKFKVEKKIVIANLAERGNMTFLARSALARSLCNTAPGVIIFKVS